MPKHGCPGALLSPCLLWPLVVHAEPFDAPQLGVRIADLPAGSKPEVIDELDGYAVRLRIGSAHGHIVRLSDPVPAGADVADAAYRARLMAYFGSKLGPKTGEAPTSVGGQTAWVTCSYWRSAFMPSVSYTCITNMIVAQHLYRLTAAAMGSEQRPPDFDAVIGVLSALAFEPPHPALAADGSAAPPPRREPQFQLPPEDFYPLPARRLGEEGAADVEFSIDGHGRARDLKTDPRSDLGKAAAALVAAASFRVPLDWEARGSTTGRFTFEIQYALAALGQQCSWPPTTRIPGATVVTVCGSRLARR